MNSRGAKPCVVLTKTQEIWTKKTIFNTTTFVVKEDHVIYSSINMLKIKCLMI